MQVAGIFQHTWTDVDWTGPLFFLARQGIPTILGFIGF